MESERNQNYKNATKEMIRADHLIYVSLKYSRTVDVIQSVIARLIEACKYAIRAGLETNYKEEELSQILHGAKTQCEALAKVYPETKQGVEFYQFLRKINKAPVLEKLNEFRRHVTFVTKVDDKKLNIKIETVEEYYNQVKDFLRLINKLIHGGEDDLLTHKN